MSTPIGTRCGRFNAAASLRALETKLVSVEMQAELSVIFWKPQRLYSLLMWPPYSVRNLHDKTAA